MLALAERLTAELGNAIPTDLGRLAERRAVRAIEFLPLLVDGGLSVTPDGFRIFVRCERTDAARFTDLFAKDGTGRKLPEPVAKRARFVIAHELAHTLLFDIGSLPPRIDVPFSKGMGVRGLEHACNDLAGAFLLPERAMLREIRDSEKLFDTSYLRWLATKALVSRAGLVVRIAHAKTIEIPIGIIASARETEGGWKLTAIARHYALRTILQGAKVGSPLESLTQKASEVLLSGGGPATLKQQGQSFECVIEPIGGVRGQRSCFVTLRRL